MSDSLYSNLVELTFHLYVQNRKQLDGPLHHADWGIQYTGGAYYKLLAAPDI